MKSKILIQLDSDLHPSVFDRVVAVDAGVDHLFSYGQVTEEVVQGLVHGAMFTRGMQDLSRTAIFIGGSNVAQGEALLRQVRKTLFKPLTVSVMLDANGANTTAAAAVLAAGDHVNLEGCRAMVLGGTGPVGQRVARLLGHAGAQAVILAGRDFHRTQQVARTVNEAFDQPIVAPASFADAQQLHDALAGVSVLINAGAAGVQLLPAAIWQAVTDLKVMVDLNAVPPLGIEGIDMNDRATAYGRVIAYGAIGVGGSKMKIHKAAIARLFQANDQVLDAEEIYAIGKNL